MKRESFLGGAATTAFALGTAAPAGAQELTTVKVGILGIGTDAPVAIADAKGFFREHGIKIEPIKFTSSETMMPLLSQTGLDIGTGAPGAKLLIRTDLIKSGKYKSIKDLKGMTIAGAARASSSAAQVTRLLAMAGLPYSAVQRTVLPYGQHVIAFQNGAIEAALTIEPFATLAVDAGVAAAFLR